jgi:hypothetical protein
MPVCSFPFSLNIFTCQFYRTKIMYKPIIALVFFAMFTIAANAQEKPAAVVPAKPSAPETLPGKGLAEHDFFYAGEGNKVMSIVKHGKVVWSYTDTSARGEISDAVLLSNGNVLFARQYGITEITPDKKLVWNYNALPGTEIHTARPIGKSLVLYMQNGNPAKLLVVNIVTGKTVLELPMAVKNLLSTHGQFRHVSLTDAGTLLVAHMDMDKVSEYDAEGKELWSVAVASPWHAIRLKNGNTLITSNKHFVREVNLKGETVWEFADKDLPDFKFSGLQTAVRLPNGNTIINNWCRKDDGTGVQAIEVSPDKKLVWALREWTPPTDLGRSTTIQVLDSGAPENMHFGALH